MADRHIQVAKNLLEQGKVIAYPTEAVWGLGCDPNNGAAVERILQLKRRAKEKGLVLVAADMSQLAPWINTQALSADQKNRLEQTWPGFYTWVIPASNLVPDWIRGNHKGVAVRVSAHPVVNSLCRAFGGPIVSTSANPSGKSPALSSQELVNYFQDAIDHIVPGELGGADSPSPIVDLLTGAAVRGS